MEGIKDRSLEESACLSVSMLAPSFAMMPSKLNVGIAKNELIVRVAPSMDYQVLSLPLNELVVRFRPFDGQPYSNPKPYSQAPPLEASSEKWRSLMFLNTKP